MSNAAVQAAANANNALAAALLLVGSGRAQAVLVALAPVPVTGLSAKPLSLNGIVPFGPTTMPQVYLTGNSGFFYLNLTDHPFLPLLLFIDEDNPGPNVFTVNGALADAPDDPFGDPSGSTWAVFFDGNTYLSLTK